MVTLSSTRPRHSARTVSSLRSGDLQAARCVGQCGTCPQPPRPHSLLLQETAPPPYQHRHHQHHRASAMLFAVLDSSYALVGICHVMSSLTSTGRRNNPSRFAASSWYKKPRSTHAQEACRPDHPTGRGKRVGEGLRITYAEKTRTGGWGRTDNCRSVNAVVVAEGVAVGELGEGVVRFVFLLVVGVAVAAKGRRCGRARGGFAWQRAVLIPTSFVHERKWNEGSK